MWVFRHKNNFDGSFKQYKAQLVGDGRFQQIGIDCNETFSPIVKAATICTVLSITVCNDWEIRQLDVKNSFLYGDRKEQFICINLTIFLDSNFQIMSVFCSDISMTSNKLYILGINTSLILY